MMTVITKTVVIRIDKHNHNGWKRGCRCDECRESYRLYRINTREERLPREREIAARYRKKHPYKMREKWKRSYYRNREHRLAYAKDYREKKREKIKLEDELYKMSDRGKMADRAARLNSRTSEGKTTIDGLWYKWEYYRGLCWVCSNTATEFDHVIPIAKGGTNWPANLRPACAECNFRKGAKKITFAA